MSNFNLNQILLSFDIDKELLSKELFPSNKFPKKALDRVLEGKSFLNTSQISILSSILGVHVHELFKDDSWTKRISANKLTMFRNNFRVELNIETLVTDVFRNDSLIASETIIFDKNVKLSEYISKIEKLIISLI